MSDSSPILLTGGICRPWQDFVFSNLSTLPVLRAPRNWRSSNRCSMPGPTPT